MLTKKQYHQALCVQAKAQAIAWRDSDCLNLQKGVDSCKVLAEPREGSRFWVNPIKDLLTDNGYKYDCSRRYLNNCREDVRAGLIPFMADEEKLARALKNTMINL